MEKKRRLRLLDKIYIITMKRGQMSFCSHCNGPITNDKGYVVESVVVEKLEFTCRDVNGYRNIVVNDEYETGNGQNFYYTKKEANKIAKLKNRQWKKHQQIIKDSKKKQIDNPVKGLPLTLYPIKGK